MKQITPIRTTYRYFDIVIAFFMATLIISNIGSTKIIGIGPFVFDGGTILFPLAYVLGDVLTEIYGLRRARRTIWIGFGVLVLMVTTLGIIQILPTTSAGGTQAAAYAEVAGFVPRIVLASITAYVIGEFINTTILARLKVRTQGRIYWLRSLGASSIGELVDTLIFSTIAFIGTMPSNDFVKLLGTVYGLKLVFELVAVGFSSYVVRWLKRNETVIPT
jgi:uncharacterized integral membrane protein (TIGR00697 family)